MLPLRSSRIRHQAFAVVPSSRASRRTASVRNVLLTMGATVVLALTAACGSPGATGGTSQDEADGSVPQGEADAGTSTPLLPCVADGWCGTELPLTGVEINGIWGSAANDVWAVGAAGATGGLIEHWGGSTWSPVDNGMYSTMFGISGTGTDDVWAVGSMGTALHWDGNSWSSFDSGTTQDLLGVWASSTRDVWAVGIGGIVHWNGSAWSQSPSSGAAQIGVWGSGPSDVWAVGGLHVDHWNGATWSSTKIDVDGGAPNIELYGVWGSGPSDAWAAGSNGLMAHWDGHSWSQVWCATQNDVTSVWANGPSEAWAVAGDEISRWNGNDWALIVLDTDPSTQFNVFWGSATDDLWVGGTEGLILHHP